MNSDVTQSLYTLNLLAQNLQTASRGGLEQQEVGVLLKLADLMQSIAQTGAQLQAYIEVELVKQPFDQTQQAALQKNQTLLSQIVAQCKGEGQAPYSLKKLGSDLSQWKLQFEKLLRQAEAVEAKQGIQTECLQLHQSLEEMQHQTIALSVDNQSKLGLLRQLMELERSLGTIEHNLQQGKGDGQEDRQRLDAVKQAMGQFALEFSLSGAT